VNSPSRWEQICFQHVVRVHKHFYESRLNRFTSKDPILQLTYAIQHQVESLQQMQLHHAIEQCLMHGMRRSLPFHGCAHLLGLTGHLSGSNRSSSWIRILWRWSFFSSCILTSTAAAATARSPRRQGVWRHRDRGWYRGRFWSQLLAATRAERCRHLGTTTITTRGYHRASLWLPPPLHQHPIKSCHHFLCITMCGNETALEYYWVHNQHHHTETSLSNW
jgi:hypothetical protein